MRNVIISQIAPEIKDLVSEYGWHIETAADNITVFSKNTYTISLSGFNRESQCIKLYDRDDIYIKREIRFLEVTNIVCSARFSDDSQLKRIIKNLSDICDKNNITMYININKAYESYEVFQSTVTEYNEMDFSLIIKNKEPYFVRFHKNEKYLFLPLPKDYVGDIIELIDKLTLYANSPTVNYAYSVIIDDIFLLLSLNKKTYKDAIIIEETLKSLKEYLVEDNESYGLYTEEINKINIILDSIKQKKSFIL